GRSCAIAHWGRGGAGASPAAGPISPRLALDARDGVGHPAPPNVSHPPNNRTSNMRKHYIALVRKDSDSDYGVSFPDFPGAVTARPRPGWGARAGGGGPAPTLRSHGQKRRPHPVTLRIRRSHQGQP